ncbi:hypothetical protein BGZ70_010555, partial [Mortierella alpina]
MSTGTPTVKSDKVSFKDDTDETDEDSDGSYEPSSELSAGILWSLRDLIVDGLPGADTLKEGRSITELEHPHEFLMSDYLYR